MRSVLLGLLLILATPAHGDESSRDYLKGLKGVFVGIGTLEHGAKEAGLAEDVLKTAIELSLRKSGIAVLEGKKLAEGNVPSEERAMLFLAVSATKLKNSPYFAFTTTLELLQPATLQRDPSIVMGVGTWSMTSTIGVGDRSDIREMVNDQLDHFMNDWLATHPKAP